MCPSPWGLQRRDKLPSPQSRLGGSLAIAQLSTRSPLVGIWPVQVLEPHTEGTSLDFMFCDPSLKNLSLFFFFLTSISLGSPDWDSLPCAHTPLGGGCPDSRTITPRPSRRDAIPLSTWEQWADQHFLIKSEKIRSMLDKQAGVGRTERMGQRELSAPWPVERDH